LFGKTPLKAQNDCFPKILGAWPLWTRLATPMLDMRLLQGNHNMFCDIHIFSATTTTAEALLFSIQELRIVECSGHVQIKFCVAFSCEIRTLRVLSWNNVCNNFIRSSVSATKISMKVLRIETI